MKHLVLIALLAVCSEDRPVYTDTFMHRRGCLRLRRRPLRTLYGAGVASG